MKRNPILRILALAAATAALGACGMFHERSDYYKSAGEGRPLEVPPDLDTPPTANELAVPQVGPGAAAAAAASGVSTVGAGELRVNGDAQDTFQRVGAALENGKIGSVTARDESARTYTVDFNGTVSTRPESEHHWYTPVLHHLGFGEDEEKQVTRHVTVAVADAGAGTSRVSVTSDAGDKLGADATRQIMELLREHLAVAAAPAPAPMAAPMTAPPAAPSEAAPLQSAPPPMSGVSVAGAELQVADSVDNTWKRVGLALQRAQIGAVGGSDESTHTYTVEFDSTVETQPAQTEHHWYSRILHPFGGGKGKTEQVRRSLVVRVSESGTGARVSVEGDTSDKDTADAARRVIEVLRDRLS